MHSQQFLVYAHCAENRRSHYDGEPFYCALCGLRFGEYLACEMPDCQLESEQIALERAIHHQAKMGPK